MEQAQKTLVEAHLDLSVFFIYSDSKLILVILGLLRMIFGTAKVQQNEVHQKTIRTLTSRIVEQNDKITKMTRKSEGHSQVVKKASRQVGQMQGALGTP